MIIKSYLAYPNKGLMSALKSALNQIDGCSIHPALNHDLIVVVTEAADKQADENLFQQLEAIPALQALAMVSGHAEPAVTA